jgi:hypothetical protein
MILHTFQAVLLITVNVYTVSPSRCDTEVIDDDGLPLPVTVGVATGGGMLIIAIAIVLAIYCTKRLYLMLFLSFVQC